jgi:sugar lactone lactonase YvrE
MNRLGNLIRRTRGALFPRALGALAGLCLAAGAHAAAAPWIDNQQPEYTVGNANPPTPNQSLGNCDYVAIDAAHGKLYITDRNNHRVLRFAYPVRTDAPFAEAVFGQADFTSSGANRNGAASAVTLNTPYGLTVSADGALWVSDHGNNRVLKIPSAYNASNGAAATVAIGQGDLTSTAATTSATGLQSPVGLFVDAAGNLWVADNGNNRVLRYANNSALVTGNAASQVIGQSLLTLKEANRGAATPAANSINSPYGLCANGTTLWIADYGNHRILRFNNASSLGNGAAASGVLGQANFTSGSANRGGNIAANTINSPGGVSVDSEGRLYVCDSFNNRLLIFAGAASKSDGAAADQLLGGTSFTTPGFLTSVWSPCYDNTYHRLVLAHGSIAKQYRNTWATTTTLTSSANPSPAGSAVTFTATVATNGGGDTAVGTVQFTEGGNTIGTGTLTAAGKASFTSSTFTEGDHTIIASYLEGYAHQASTSSTLTQIIGRFTPTISLVPAANPSSAGDALVLTASLTPPSGTTTVPSGTVQLGIDGTPRASTALNASGIATWTVSDLTVGPHTLTATYTGDTRFRPVTATLNQAVNPVGKRSFYTVANVEYDIKGTEVIIYNGPDQGNQVYVGNYDGYDFWSAFRFEFPTQSSSIEKAQFRVRISGKSVIPPTFTIELHGSVDDNWSDTTALRTAPATMLPAVITTVTADSAGLNEWLTFDVTEFVRTQIAGDKKATFIVTANSVPTGALVGFHSRETVGSGPVLEITEAMSFIKWASANFTAAELANSAISGASADPDGSGISNLVRYACGLPARGPVAAPGTATFNTGTNPATATFSFPMCAAAADLSYEVQTSPDLATWMTAASYTTTGTARTVASPVSAPTGAKRFFVRLRISTTP